MKHTQWYILKVRGENNRISFTMEEAAEIANKIGIDFSKEKFNLNEFTMGVNVELEHGTKLDRKSVV